MTKKEKKWRSSEFILDELFGCEHSEKNYFIDEFNLPTISKDFKRQPILNRKTKSLSIEKDSKDKIKNPERGNTVI